MKNCERARSVRIRRFILCLIVGFASAASMASDGDLDLTFANQGGLYWDYGAYFDGYPGDEPRTVLAQPDGALVVISNVFERSSAGAFYVIGVTRLLADGSFDASFGDPITPGQILLTPAAGDPNQSWYAAAGVLSADGNIVISGSVAPDFYNANSQAAAWRLTSNGMLDPSFGNAGLAVIDRGVASPTDSAYALVVGDGNNEPLDSVVLGGQVSDNDGHADAALFFLAADGTPLVVGDASIGNQQLPNGGSWWRGQSSCPSLSDGKGLSYFQSLSFDALYFSGTSSHYLIATGSCSEQLSSFPERAIIAAFDSSSNLDASFGDAGMAYFGFGSSIATEPSTATAMQVSYNTIFGDELITVAGYVIESDSQYHVGVAQIVGTGQFNQFFGNFGHLTINLGGCCGGVIDRSYALSLLNQRDGKILLAGTKNVDYGNHDTILVMRLNPYGGGDPSFGSLGPLLGAREYTVPGSAGPENEGSAMVFTAGEKIALVAGTGYGFGNYPNYTGVIRLQNDRVFTDDFEGLPVSP